MELINKYIVFFDGDCNLCNFWVRQVLKNERKDNIYFADLNSAFSKNKLTQLGINSTNIDSIVVLFQNKAYTKSDAISLILRQLKFPYPFLSFILKLIPNLFTDFFYDWIAKYRLKIFGKTEHCDYKIFHKKKKMLE